MVPMSMSPWLGLMMAGEKKARVLMGNQLTAISFRFDTQRWTLQPLQKPCQKTDDLCFLGVMKAGPVRYIR